MPATLRMDTLKFVRKLTEAGMDRPIAEAIVEGLAEADMSDLATKADIGTIRGDLDALRDLPLHAVASRRHHRVDRHPRQTAALIAGKSARYLA